MFLIWYKNYFITLRYIVVYPYLLNVSLSKEIPELIIMVLIWTCPSHLGDTLTWCFELTVEKARLLVSNKTQVCTKRYTFQLLHFYFPNIYDCSNLQKKTFSNSFKEHVLCLIFSFSILAFDPTDRLRRTDSKESNCSSMTSMSHREDLRQTLSVPASAFVSF